MGKKLFIRWCSRGRRLNPPSKALWTQLLKASRAILSDLTSQISKVPRLKINRRCTLAIITLIIIFLRHLKMETSTMKKSSLICLKSSEFTFDTCRKIKEMTSKDKGQYLRSKDWRIQPFIRRDTIIRIIHLSSQWAELSATPSGKTANLAFSLLTISVETLTPSSMLSLTRVVCTIKSWIDWWISNRRKKWDRLYSWLSPYFLMFWTC